MARAVAGIDFPETVIPAKAGTQGHAHRPENSTLGSRLRGNDVVVGQPLKPFATR